MTAVLRAPLVPAAASAVCIALAVQIAPVAGIALAVMLAGAFAILAVASADRARRLCWCAAALVAGVSAGATLFGPLPGFDLRHAGPLDGLREALAEPLRRLLPEPEGGIVRGIVLGERAAVDADLASAFARSGTSHLLAISGFNMTLVATAVALIARGRVRPAITATLTVSCVLAYSVLVGLAPSVARAAVMAVVASLGLAFGRRAATDNALALAVATMVGIDASAIGDVGFLLSATATGGLLYLGDPISRRLAFLPGAIRQGLATTLAATLPTIPIIAAVFGRVSLVSPLANLVAVPLFPPLMLAGAATSALGAVSLDLAQLPGLLAYALAFLLRVVVETSAGLPLASVAVPDEPLAGLAYGALVSVALFFGPAGLSRLARAIGGQIRWRSPHGVRLPSRSHLARNCHREANQSGLRRSIVRLSGLAHLPEDRSDVDDPSPALFKHGADGMLRTHVGGCQVGIEHRVPVAALHSHDELVAGDARVVDENVDFAKLGNDGLEHRLKLLFIFYIGGESTGEDAGASTRRSFWR